MLNKCQCRIFNNKLDINNNILQLFSLLMLTINNNLSFHNSSKFRVNSLHTKCNNNHMDSNKYLVKIILLGINTQCLSNNFNMANNKENFEVTNLV